MNDSGLVIRPFLRYVTPTPEGFCEAIAAGGYVHRFDAWTPVLALGDDDGEPMQEYIVLCVRPSLRVSIRRSLLIKCTIPPTVSVLTR